MNKILEVNTEDMYVTVEVGCSWKKLQEALKEKGVRTPFWGPLSGLTSTIGGGLSQNNAFFGASTHGPVSDSVISITTVLTSGECIRTGSALNKHGNPFFRHYGPDLTGLFLSDAGALGIKTQATLRLIPLPKSEAFASFEFDELSSFIAAASAIARSGLACELFGFDPELQKLRLKRASLISDVKSLGKVIQGQKNMLSGLVEASRVAMAGRNFATEGSYCLHCVVEGHHETAVKLDLEEVRSQAFQYGGREIPNSIPKVVRADPFLPANGIVGPEGERWVPVHGIVPHSKAEQAWKGIHQVFDDMRDLFETHRISVGFLPSTLSNNGFLIEPVFFWPEELWSIHEQTVEASYLNKVPRHVSNPKATQVVTDARQRVIDVFQRCGGVHFQIGKTYPYIDNAHPEVAQLVKGLKSLLDPEGLVNPGALGL